VGTSIAHDLRTPLGHLRQKLEAMREGSVTPERREVLLDEALRQLDASLETFSSLLRIAEVESGSRRGGFETVCLSDILASLVEVYQPVAEDNGQRLSANIHPSLQMRGERGLLTQLFANLVENALRHSGPGSAIHLGLDVSDEGFAATVSDTGPGIDAAEYENVFKPFYRLDASRTRQGSGLGMSLVAAIASLHGLSLSLGDNRPGLKVTVKGATQTGGQRRG
jgi:signal transduction histidine kinase